VGQRWLLLNELATTEESYMLQLTELLFVFRGSLADPKKKAASKEDLDTIFANVETLLRFHTMPSQDLRAALASWVDENGLAHMDGPEASDYLGRCIACEMRQRDATPLTIPARVNLPHARR
jgi:guanine nucleotide exchange factor for Rho/Rac/Cdc42-like GTPase family protein